MPLSDLEIRNAKPRERRYKLFDGDGLHVLVQPNGSKLWRLKYAMEGKERVISFGKYPLITLAVARQKADAARAKILNDQDPLVEARVPTDNTFETIARAWHAVRHEQSDPAHQKRVIGRLERDAFAQFGDRDIREIGTSDVLGAVKLVEARGAHDIARRLKQDVESVFRYAKAHGWVSVVPTADIRPKDVLKAKPRVQHMSRMKFGELPDFFRRLDRYREQGNEATVLAIELTILTWARTTEIREAEWSEFGDDLWTVPPERMKKHRLHLIPLSRQAQAIVKRLREIKRSERYVFPHDRKPHLPASQNMMLQALYNLGLRGRQTMHGFRNMASTWANEQTKNELRLYDKDWVELALAHAEEDEVRAAYNAAEYLPQRARMLQAWADFIDRQRPDEFDRLIG
jgi:integrase